MLALINCVPLAMTSSYAHYLHFPEKVKGMTLQLDRVVELLIHLLVNNAGLITDRF